MNTLFSKASKIYGVYQVVDHNKYGGLLMIIFFYKLFSNFTQSQTLCYAPFYIKANFFFNFDKQDWIIMRCSLKDGFIILLIFSFTPFEAKGYPLFLYKNSKADRSINFNDLSAMSRVEQILDSFPKLGDYDKNSHKIVKKQMTASDYKHTQKKKRSIFILQENSNYEGHLKHECREKTEQAKSESASNGNRKKKELAISALKRRRDLGIDNNFFKKKLAKGEASFRRNIFSKKQKLKKINEKESQQTEEKEIQNSLNTDKEKSKQIKVANDETQNENEKKKVAEKITENTSEVGNKNAKEKAEEEISENASEVEDKNAKEKAEEEICENASEVEDKNAKEKAVEEMSEDALKLENQNAKEKAVEEMSEDALKLENQNAKEKAVEEMSEDALKLEGKNAKEKAVEEMSEDALKLEGKNAKEKAVEEMSEDALKFEDKNAKEKAVEEKSKPASDMRNRNTVKNAKETENKNALGKAKVMENNKPLQSAKAKENKNLETKISSKKINLKFNQNDIEEQYKFLKSMVGCKMNNYCRFPDVQDNHNYFECDADGGGCMKLVHKTCPDGEVFSSRFLECVKPFFWKLVEREKRSLWKKEKKLQCFNNWGDSPSPNAWTDVTHEEGRQFPSELRSKCKPKLIVYHLKVKKSINEAFKKKKKEQRHILRMPPPTHSEISRKMTYKAANVKSRDHQLFPRSFIIRINKKEGGKSDHEEKLSGDDTDEATCYSDDEDDDDDDEEEEEEEDDDDDDDDVKETSDEDEYEEDDAANVKPMEKSGIKEFFKSAKEVITNRAKFNEPADTSFTLDKTNSYNKNKKLDGSVKDSKKVLIDADIKVDKALGKTLKKILGKRRDKDDSNVSLNGNLSSNRGNQNLKESEQIATYENLIRSNPRLKRYFLVSLGDAEN